MFFFNRNIERLIIYCMFFPILIIFLFLFWGNLLALATPNIHLLYIATDLNRQIQTVLIACGAIILSIDSLAAGELDTSPAISNIVTIFFTLAFGILEPVRQINKELAEGKDLVTILQQHWYISCAFVFGILYLAILLFSIYRKKKLTDYKQEAISEEIAAK